MSSELLFRILKNNQSSPCYKKGMFLYETILEELYKMNPPITPSMVRGLCLKYGDKDVKKYMPNKVSFDELEHLGENIFELKDGNAKQVGEFLHVAMPMVKRSNVKDSHPTFKSCNICYKLTLNSIYCLEHDRLSNHAGYRRGQRIKKRLAAKINKIDPTVFLGKKEFLSWIMKNTPYVYKFVGKRMPMDALIKLDGYEFENTEIQKQKIKEYQRLIGKVDDGILTVRSFINKHGEHLVIAEDEALFKFSNWTMLSEKEQYNLLFQKYLLEADRWLQASQKENRGGTRVGAGRRPKSKA